MINLLFFPFCHFVAELRQSVFQLLKVARQDQLEVVRQGQLEVVRQGQLLAELERRQRLAGQVLAEVESEGVEIDGQLLAELRQR
jgi:hypothetical protein